ncbi:MAG: hypothetical protein VB949_04145 [Pseudomonadales bacterium]|jgi:hypothetical protein
MRKLLTTCTAAVLGFFALSACADTEQIDSTAYQVVLEEPTPYTTPQGNTVLLGGRQHASVVAADGAVSSQYCTGNAMPAEDGGLANGAGFCTVVQANGDVIWVWYKITGGGTNTWGAIGGTGEYEGATGGGTSSVVSQGGDGRSAVSKITGTITTP